jgi:hypothetical protein
VLAGLAALASLGACTCAEPPEVSTTADAVTDAAYCAELGRLALRYTGHAGGNGGLAPDYTTLDANSGERVKTNRRDALTLARLFRAGELTAVWVPDDVHEAVRDLVRGRMTAAEDLRRKRQQLLSFLLRHGRIFTGGDHLTRAHHRWLAAQSFVHPAQQIVFQDAVAAIEDAVERLRRLEEQLVAIVPKWSMAPLVAAYQAMRGVSFLVAVTFAAEIGDVRRPLRTFTGPRSMLLAAHRTEVVAA